MADISRRRIIRSSIQAGAALLLAFGVGECSGAAVFTNVQGKVLWSAGGEQGWVQAKPGQELKYGSRIKAGWLSWAEIRYEDNSLVALGPESDFSVFTATQKESFSKLHAGFMRAVIKKAGAKFSVRTASAIVTPKGARFSVLVTVSGKTRVRAFSGTVSVLDNKNKETVVKPDENLVADAEGAGETEAAPVTTLFGAWVLDPPYGFKERKKGSWSLVTEEASGINFKGRPVILEHYDSFTRETREVNWKKGQQWPGKCADDSIPNDVRTAATGGKTMFYYACPAADLSRATWQDRYYEVPLDPEDGGKSPVIRLHYNHRVQAKLPPAAELRRIYGSRTPAEYSKRFQAEAMPAVAADTPKSKVDGPGLKAVLESVMTLYQENWAERGSYTGKVVPSIE